MEKLKQMRQTMTISEIARKIGTSEMNVYRWTTGRAKMSEAWRELVRQRTDDGRKE